MPQLAAARQGEAGPPLLLLHGLFGSARNWMRIARVLGQERQVHALDLPNHGDSPWTETTDYPAMAAAVLDYLDAAGLQSAAILGHSMGGKVAMTLALTRPERVGKLIVADIAPVAYDHANLDYIRAMQALDLAQITRRAEAEAGLADAVCDPVVRAFLVQNLVSDGPGYRWRINLEGLARSMLEIHGFPESLLTHSFAGPTLFLAGERSDYLRAEHGALIRRLFPAARIESVPGAGHWVHAENPDGFLAAVTAFLAS